MITGVIQLDFAVAGIDRQPLLIAEKCVARLILTAGGVRMFAKFFWSPALWCFHRRHWFHFRHGFHTFQSEPLPSEKFPAFGSPVNASSRTSRCTTHDPGPVWFAIPFLLETSTPYSLPISRRTSLRFRTDSAMTPTDPARSLDLGVTNDGVLLKRMAHEADRIQEGGKEI